VCGPPLGRNRWASLERILKMGDSNQENSEHGDPIYRHETVKHREIEPSIQNPAQRQIDEHITKYFVK
jgi:hypothetical protein